VDFNGVVLLDIFVSPTLPVVDYRTRVHGIRKHDLDNGKAAFSFCQTMKFILSIPSGQPFVDVKQLVEELFRGALVVGHSLEHHLDVCGCILNLLPDVDQIPVLYKALAIKHPSQQLRDTAVLGARVQSGWTPSLKKLVASELQVTIQNDKRSSVCQFFFPFSVSLFTLQSIGRGCSSSNGDLQDVSKRLE
jgi:RNA exonuclease 4